MIFRSPRPDVEIPDLSLTELLIESAEPFGDKPAFVAERVAPHKKIRLAERVEQIPKSLSGKISRRVLSAREN